MENIPFFGLDEETALVSGPDSDDAINMTHTQSL